MAMKSTCVHSTGGVGGVGMTDGLTASTGGSLKCKKPRWWRLGGRPESIQKRQTARGHRRDPGVGAGQGQDLQPLKIELLMSVTGRRTLLQPLRKSDCMFVL